MNKPGLLIVLSSPSGGGKTTLRSNLISKIFPHLHYSISMTTRKPRPYEIDGEDYSFVSEDEFLQRRDKGEFIEWAKVHNNYYGTPYPYVQKCLEKGEDVILDIDTQGALAIKEKVPAAILIFILPPSLESLAARLYQREQQTQSSVIAERLKVAHQEISHIEHYDYVVVNKEIAAAIEILKAILIAEKWRVNRLDVTKIISSDDFEFLLADKK